MVAPHRTGVRDLSHSTILRQDLLRKTLVPPLVPARGSLVACLTGLLTLTSTHIYVIHYSTYTRVPGSVSIHSLHIVVLDYGELLAYWFTLHGPIWAAYCNSAHMCLSLDGPALPLVLPRDLLLMRRFSHPPGRRWKSGYSGCC
jgi:hypothetical protein